MKFGIALFAKLGLFARKATGGPDMFDARLQRSRAREYRNPARARLFKNRPSPLEA